MASGHCKGGCDAEDLVSRFEKMVMGLAPRNLYARRELHQLLPSGLKLLKL
jgi:hypothetical protein